MIDKQIDSARENVKKTISVGLIGYGGIGKLHTVNWRNLQLYYPDIPVKLSLRGAAARTRDSADQAVQQGGFEYGTTDYQELLDDPEISLIDICTPNNLHYPMVFHHNIHNDDQSPSSRHPHILAMNPTM